jgi:hypothetical protein
MWEESANADSLVANFQDDLAKEYSSNGSWHDDYKDICQKHSVIPCSFIRVSNGVCKFENCSVDLSSWRCALLANLASSGGITAVHIHNCKLGIQHFNDLILYISKLELGLDNLKISYVTFEDGIRSQCIEAISGLFSTDVRINYLCLRGLGLEDDTISRIVPLLQANYFLKSLNFSDNRITDIGASEVIRALRANMAIREISLAKNSITGENSLGMLADLLRGTAVAPEDDSAVKAVSKALADFNKKIKDANKKRKKDKLPELPELHGSAKDRCVKVEGQMTLANRGISVIDLSYNPINLDAARPVLETLKGRCGPGAATNAFGKCALSLLLNGNKPGGGNGSIPPSFNTLSSDLLDLGVSLVL